MRSGIDQQLVHQLGRLVQQIVGQDGGIRQNHALHRGVRDVALVPQRHIFEGRLHVGPHHARQAADLLAGHRIALVRHGRAALLPAREILLGLAHFGALQVAHFERDLLAQRGQSAPARRRSWRAGRAGSPARPPAPGFRFELRADQLLGLRVDVAEGAHRARNLADAHVLGRRAQPRRDCGPPLRTRWPASART